MTASCLYSGTIRHRRGQPLNEFRHRLALAYVDLGELPGLLGGRLVARRPGALRVRRRDYLGPHSVSLDAAVRDRVQRIGGTRPAGPIRLLTQPRSFGLCFNPVSFYYCFDPGGERLHSVLAEVTNTPWGERHSYLLGRRDRGDGIVAGSFAKQLHVSPFLGMDHRYEARATTPASTLSVHIESRRHGDVVFDATLSLERRELTSATAARIAPGGARALALIYAHAAGLKLKGAGVHPHPRTAAP